MRSSFLLCYPAHKQYGMPSLSQAWNNMIPWKPAERTGNHDFILWPRPNICTILGRPVGFFVS